MTKQEQINEMAKIIALEGCGDCNNCKGKGEYGCYFNAYKDNAEAIYDAGYRKVKKGDIIIHKDEKERTDEEVKWLMEHNAEVRKRHEKFLEDSGNIILTKEDMQKYAKDCLIGEVAGLDILNGEIARGERKAKEARKETAKEILQQIYNLCKVRGSIQFDDIYYLVNRYGVEVEG